MSQFTKLNEKFGIINFPVTIAEMEQILLEFPKTERKFYEFALKALKKVMKTDEKIYSFEVADPKLTKTGFVVVAEHNLIFLTMKGGLFGGANAEVVKYTDIKSVDFDIIEGPLGISFMNTGILYLHLKGVFGGKKRTVRNIPDYNLDSVIKAIRERI